MDQASNLAQKSVSEGFSFQVGGLLFEPNYIQAAAIVGLTFLLILTLARLRRMYADWSLKGSMTMVFLGFMLAIIIEGFLILGGRTALTEVLGWKNAPKPIQVALDSGREKLVDVLGESAQTVPDTYAGNTGEGVIRAYQSLNTDDATKVKKLICTP